MLKEIVSSLEVSKKLKELGIKTETEFLFNQAINDNDDSYYITIFNSDYDYFGSIPAYTLEQILNLLPKSIEWGGDLWTEEETDYLEINNYSGRIQYPLSDLFTDKEENENLATTAARLLIKLHEEGLLTKEGIKND